MIMYNVYCEETGEYINNQPMIKREALQCKKTFEKTDKKYNVSCNYTLVEDGKEY